MACDYYTIQNDYKEDVRAGYVVIKDGQCLEFFDLPFLGDFPLKFRYKDHQLISDKLYSPGHYTVSKTADILKQNQPCELDPVREKDGLRPISEKKNRESQENTKANEVKDNPAETFEELDESTTQIPKPEA